MNSLFDERVLLLLWNSLRLCVSVASISVPVGIFLALVVARTDIPLRRTLGLAVAGLLILPLYLQGAAWDAGFGRQGWYTYLSDMLVQPLLVGWRATIWIHALAAIPWVTLIVSVVLRTVERELEERALLDLGPWRTMWMVTLRRASPALVVAALWVVFQVAGEMTITDMYQVRTFAEETYTSFALGDDVKAVGGKIAIPAWALTTVLVIWGLGWWESFLVRASHTMTTQPLVFGLRRGRWWALAAASAMVVVMFAVPLGSLVYKAGLVVTQQDGMRIRVWSLEHFVEILSLVARRFRAEFVGTTVLASASATLVMLLALPLSWFWQTRGPGRWCLAALVSVGLAVPGPVIGLIVKSVAHWSSVALMDWRDDRSLLPATVALAIRALPLATFLAWCLFRSLPTHELDAARLDGAGRISLLARFAIPRRRRELFATWCVAFLVCAGDLAAITPALPPSVATLAFTVFQLVHAGVDDQLAGLCLIVVVTTLVFGGGVLTLFQPLVFRDRRQQNENRS